jgi:hypothetical protein
LAAQKSFSGGAAKKIRLDFGPERTKTLSAISHLECFLRRNAENNISRLIPNSAPGTEIICGMSAAVRGFGAAFRPFPFSDMLLALPAKVTSIAGLGIRANCCGTVGPLRC